MKPHLITLLALAGGIGLPVLDVRAVATSDTTELSVRVDGLTCPFCGYGIEKRIKRLEAVATYRVNVREGTVTLVFSPGRAVRPEEVREAITASGFTARGMILAATGVVAYVDSHPTFTLAGVEPSIRYRVSADSKASGLDAMARSRVRVRIMGRLEPVGKSGGFELAIDIAEAVKE